LKLISYQIFVIPARGLVIRAFAS